ncbi:MAG: hypothetical protein M1814_001458 [Vezdaea aestivalis]|nr:MAG: hypothetical protein M1814_001458 [Vezdaea aestivalis]
MYPQNFNNPYDLPNALQAGVGPGTNSRSSLPSRPAAYPPLDRPQYVAYNSNRDARKSSSSVNDYVKPPSGLLTSSPRPESTQQAPGAAPPPARWSRPIQSTSTVSVDKIYSHQANQQNASFDRWSPFNEPRPASALSNANNQPPWSRSDSSLTILHPPSKSSSGNPRSFSLAKEIQADEHRRKTEKALARLQEEEEERFQFVKQMDPDTIYSDTPRHHYDSKPPDKMRSEESSTLSTQPEALVLERASHSETAPQMRHSLPPLHSYDPPDLSMKRRVAPKPPLPLGTSTSSNSTCGSEDPPTGVFSDLDDIIKSLGSRDHKRKYYTPAARADTHELSAGPSTRRRTIGIMPESAPHGKSQHQPHEVNATERQVQLPQSDVLREQPEERVCYELATEKSFRRPASGEIRSPKTHTQPQDWRGHLNGREMVDVERSPRDPASSHHAEYIAKQQLNGQWQG